MGLDSLGAIARAFSSVAANLVGLGSVLVLVGFTILAIIGVSYFIYIVVKALKMLPNLTVKQFITGLTIFAAALVLIGILLP